jgi:hypothetical protein
VEGQERTKGSTWKPLGGKVPPEGKRESATASAALRAFKVGQKSESRVTPCNLTSLPAF